MQIHGICDISRESMKSHDSSPGVVPQTYMTREGTDMWRAHLECVRRRWGNLFRAAPCSNTGVAEIKLFLLPPTYGHFEKGIPAKTFSVKCINFPLSPL